MCAACSNELKYVTNSNAYRLITGVGIFQTVYNLTLALAQKKYDLVITAGIAGDSGLGSSCRVGCRTEF